MVRAVVLVVVSGAVCALVVPVSALAASPVASPVHYEHPVDAEIVDPFRAPTTRFGPGNRGLKYATEPGDDIAAAAPGIVVFAGQAGGALHITVEHADGRLTSYSGVGEILVGLHRSVSGGEIIARARGVVHVGVRELGEYIDPELLFGSHQIVVQLIAENPIDGGRWRTPGQEAAELAMVAQLELGGRNVVGLLGGLAASAVGLGIDVVGQRGVVWELMPSVMSMLAGPLSAAVVFDVIVPLVLGEQAPLLGLLTELSPLTVPARVVVRTRQWNDHRSNCTPADQPPEPAEGRRIAVLVAGRDSASDQAAIGRLRTDDLGYRDGDVVGFSYLGGRTPGRFSEQSQAVAADLQQLEVNPYDRSHSSLDLAQRGALLAELLADVAEHSPGTPVDVYAHSQGGLVLQIALHDLATRPNGSTVIDSLGLVATLASPHQGSDLARAAVIATEGSGPASLLLGTMEAMLDTSLHPDRSNVGDLAVGSALTRSLQTRQRPVGPSYLTLGARGDWLVLDTRSRADGVRHVTVPVGGLTAHSTMTGEPTTTRELALALSGAPPTCQGFGSFLIDLTVTEALRAGSIGIGVGALSMTLVEPVSWRGPGFAMAN